jgi:hypothetical protein
MNNVPLRLLAAIVTSLMCWTIIDLLIVPIPLHNYLVAEVIITIMQRLYNWQLKNLNHATKE